jgi:hypothetical protein
MLPKAFATKQKGFSATVVPIGRCKQINGLEGRFSERFRNLSGKMKKSATFQTR